MTFLARYARRGRQTILLTVFLVGIAACGGSDSTSPSTPVVTPAATITITASGVSPRTVTVSPGSQVLFINNDTREHQMYSDPHPEHTDCPPFDQVGALTPGQSRATGNLNVVRICNFHDHLRFEDNALRGSVIIR
jgi:plastocyanin